MGFGKQLSDSFKKWQDPYYESSDELRRRQDYERRTRDHYEQINYEDRKRERLAREEEDARRRVDNRNAYDLGAAQTALKYERQISAGWQRQ
ncbi:MAG: hypothetical protein Q9218_005794, partial [Villophora microphyllina]